MLTDKATMMPLRLAHIAMLREDDAELADRYRVYQTRGSKV